MCYTHVALCSFVGSPLSPDKPVSPTMCLTFLGLTFDMINQVVTIPSEKIGEAIILIVYFMAFESYKITVKSYSKLQGNYNL